MPEKCPFCDKEIQDDWSPMIAGEGYVYWNDANGQFAHRHNMDDWSPPRPKDKEKPLSGKALADALIAVVDDPLDEKKASKARELIIRQAASVATKGGAQAMTALSNLATLVDEAFGKLKRPEEHKKCPLCKREAKAQKIVIDAPTCAALALVQLRHNDTEAAMEILKGGLATIDPSVYTATNG